MKFDRALKLMKDGKKVKLPSWSGYWCWDDENETIMMHCRPQDSDKGQGPILDIRETKRVEYTLQNILSDEWITADETNCPILGGESTFDFGNAIKYLKRGLKVKRKEWNDKDQFLVYIDPYINDQFNLIETNPLGTFCAYIAIKTTDNAIIPWFPGQSDMLAKDWIFAE